MCVVDNQHSAHGALKAECRSMENRIHLVWVMVKSQVNSILNIQWMTNIFVVRLYWDLKSNCGL